MLLGPSPPFQNSQRPHPGAQTLSQIPVGGDSEGNQMPHICPRSPPLGLTLIGALQRYKPSMSAEEWSNFTREFQLITELRPLKHVARENSN